jgi:antitoxin PrlF
LLEDAIGGMRGLSDGDQRVNTLRSSRVRLSDYGRAYIIGLAMSETKERQERYEGSVVQVGNSRGIRLPAGFFNAHSEFAGKVQVTVVADGAVLLSARKAPRRKTKDDEDDPVVAGFLQFLEEQMAKHPEDIAAADADQLRRVGKLVKGVKVE